MWRTAVLLLLGAVLTGVGLAAALPPARHSYVAWIAIAPLLAVVSGKGLFKGFIGALIACVALAATIRSGLFYDTPKTDGGAGFILLGVFFFGLVITGCAVASSEWKRDCWYRIPVLASVAVILEFCTAMALPAHLALTMARTPDVVFLASFGGIWLVSWLLWLFNLLVADLIIRRRWLAPAFVAVVLFLLLPLLPPRRSSPGTTVAAIQTAEIDSQTMTLLNAEARAKNAEVAIWPEFSGMLIAPDGDTRELRTLSSKPEQAAFVTTFRDSTKPLPHNTAVLFSGGTESEPYHKRKPFGGEFRMHHAGEKAVAAPFGVHGSLGLNICFDSCFPGIISDTAKLPRVTLIALPTIDPESEYSFVAGIHAAFTPFRAAEQGVPIVRADGNAYSQIVDNRGVVIAEMVPGEQGVLASPVMLHRRWTLYSVLGDWWLYLSSITVAATVIAGLRRRYSRTETPVTLQDSSKS